MSEKFKHTGTTREPDFMAWWKSLYPNDDGGYCETLAWEAWQASRNSPSVWRCQCGNEYAGEKPLELSAKGKP